MSATRRPDQSDRSDIAIIGMSGRFPGAPSIDAFWQNLCDGIESRVPVSEDEIRRYGLPASALNHPTWVKSGFPVDDVEMFDAAFFGINPREAEVMDPQHRLFLECAWEALENAGYDSERFGGSVAVFGGATHSLYLTQNVLRNTKTLKMVGGRQATYGSVADYMITRVAYKLNLRGPCCFVQSACSTSLIAVHLGCQSLQSHESDLAVAGGVSVQLPQRLGYFYEEGGMMSPDGRVRAFDLQAQGTVFGSGVGIVVLKRLSDALADGDRIHAVIKGIAANNDGSFKVGFTAPSVIGQSQVVAEALGNAGVPPDTIGYVEAHGTGTELGDPIEIAALTRAYSAGTDRTGFCAVGSVKPNIGHLDAAAGVSSLIKTVMALQHEQIPPTINFEHPNPKIDFENSPFYVNTTLRPWPANGTPRRAGVSSFGFGGTNVHVIVEEAPETPPSGPSRSHQLVLLSAKSERALDHASVRLAEHLAGHKHASLADAAFTLQVGRRLFKHRRAVVSADVAEAVEALQGEQPGRVATGQAAARVPSIVFMFPGQGSQYVNMGLGLYREEPTFRAVVDECADRLLPDLGFDLRHVLYPAEGPTAEAADRLRHTSVAQPALFVIELALARLWMSWGVKPSAMIGHSIGEFVAACIAGVMSVEDALRLVALRGRLMADMQPGLMLAVPLPEDEVRRLLPDDMWLSAVNAPALSVVSGAGAPVDAFAARLRDQGIECRALHTSHAFHSGMMDDAVEPFVAIAKTVELRRPQIPYLSNVTGTWITDDQAQDPAYWGRHLRGAVRFADGAATLVEDADRLYLEVGPGATLGALVRQQAKNALGATIPTLRPPQEDTPDERVLLSALGRVWLAGVDVDWAGFYQHERRCRVPLPSYPFERKRFWVDPEIVTRANESQFRAMAEMADFGDWFYAPTWKRSPLLPVPVTNGHDQPEICLLFRDADGVADRVASEIAARGVKPVIVDAGDRFEEIATDRYTVRPAVREDYTALLRALRGHNLLPTRVGHFWGLARLEDRSAVSTQACLEHGFYSLLHFAQGWGDLGLTSAVRLTVATCGAFEVTGQETLAPEKATAVGPIKVIPQEFPNVRCRHVDLETAGAQADHATIVRLVSELCASDAQTRVAYRHGRRWTHVFEPIRFEPAPEKLAPHLRDGGVYLITGGLGGVGLTLADYLARKAHAKLILISRHGLPASSSWADYLSTHGPDDAVSRRIRTVKALEDAGAEVMVGAADVVDERAMAEVVRQARERFGRIDGVIHAAGVAGGGMIQLKEPAVAAAVLAPKVTGTQVLERVLTGQSLDFLILCSSLTGVLGGVGQVDYCAANAYLDAFATHFAKATGTFTVAVNWNAWREVGMAVDTDVPADLRNTLKGNMLAAGISNREALDAFERILTWTTESQIALSPFDVQALLDSQLQAADDAHADGLGDEAAADSGKATTRPNIQTAYVAPTNDAQKKICAIWRDMLGVDPVGIYDNFFDLGGHSLLAVQVMARVNQALNTQVPVAKLYEGLNVAFLAAAAATGPDTQTATAAEDAELAERRREKARRQKEQQQRRRVALGR